MKTDLFLLASLSLSACIASAPESEPGDTPDGSGATGVAAYGNPADTTMPYRVLDVAYQAQTTSYWCGPTASSMALSARMPAPTQQAMANQLHTTTNGTDWIGQVTGVLNANLKASWYVTREMPNDPPTAAQRDQLW